MESIYHGDLASRRGRLNAWIDSLFIDHAVLRLLWANAGVVVPGHLYHSNHPTPGRLARARRRLGIRSVINLRGATRSGSDALSRAQAARLGITLIDLPLSSGRAPPRDLLLALIDALHTAPPPILVHCKSGADRACFAAAIAVLLDGGNTTAALRRMSWRHGHLRHSRAGVLDAVLRRYAAEGEGRMAFRDWVQTMYDPEDVTRRFRPGGLAGFIADRILRRE